MKYSKWAALRLGLVVALLLVSVTPCQAEPIAVEVPKRTAPVDFERDVLPILRANCVACHNATKAEGKLNLENPATILSGGEQGPAVIAGKGADSRLLKVAAHREESFMPPAGNTVGAKALTPAQLGLLQLWIDQGAQGNVSAQRKIQWQTPGKWQPILAAVVTLDGQEAIYGRGNQLLVSRLSKEPETITLVDPVLPTPAAHTDFVRSVTLDGSGQWLASGGFGEIKLWRRPSLRLASTAASPSDITQLACSADGQFLACADGSGRVQIRDIATDKLAHNIAAHSAAITGLCFAPDGKTLYTASEDKTVRAWQISDGKEHGTAKQSSAPLRSLVIANKNEWLLAGGSDGVTRAWSLATTDEQPLHEFPAHQGAVNAIAAVPDSADWFSAGEDGMICRWQAGMEKPVQQWPHDSPVVALAISPDGERLASVGGGKLRLWMVRDGKMLIEHVSDPQLQVAVNNAKARLAILKSDAQLAQQDIKSYEGTERRVMTTEMDIKKAQEELAKATKTRDEKKAEFEKVPESDAKKRESAQNALNEAETGILVANTIIDRAKVIAERAKTNFENAKTDLAAREELAKQGEAAVEAAIKKQKETPAAFQRAVFSRDGSQLFVASADGMLLSFTNQGSYLQAEAIAGNSPVTVQALRHAASDRLLLATNGKTLQTWEAPTKWKLQHTVCQTTSTSAPVDRVLSLAFSPDNQQLAAASGVPGNFGELKLWDLSGKFVREINTGHTDAIFSVRYSPDGSQIATASADRTIRIFDCATGQRKHTLEGHTAHVLGLAWQETGNHVVSSGAERVLKLWDAQTGNVVRTMKGTMYKVGPYRGEVTAVAFIGNTERYVAACGDGTIRLHRTTSENEMTVFKGASGYQNAVAATPDGQTIIAGGADGILRVWSGMESGVKQTLKP